MARPRAFNENLALNSAMFLFWQQGYEATSMKDIESVTGLRPSSIYNTFGNKNTLFSLTLEHYHQKVLLLRINSFLVDGDVLAGITQFFTTCFENIEKKESPSACFLVNTSCELGSKFPNIHKQLVAADENLKNAFESCIERGQASGQLPKTYQPGAMARHLLSILQGLLILSKIKPDKTYLNNAIKQTMSLLE